MATLSEIMRNLDAGRNTSETSNNVIPHPQNDYHYHHHYYYEQFLLCSLRGTLARLAIKMPYSNQIQYLSKVMTPKPISASPVSGTRLWHSKF